MKDALKQSHVPGLGVCLFGLVLLAAGCSGSGSSEGLSAGVGQGGAGISLGYGGSESMGTLRGTGGATITNCGELSVNGCVGAAYEGESVPLDIYIMFDQSGSMLNDVGGVTRLRAVQDATAAFLRDPESEGIGVGIGYFGFLPIGQVSCAAETYAHPDVPVTLDHEKVILSLEGRMPTGETPTAAALRGACGYAQSFMKATPGHAVAVLLVTDGKPEAPVSCSNGGCCPTLEDATSVVAECLAGNPSVPTYVLGVGPNLENLGRIAEAGGTRSAYLVGDQNVSTNVLDALNRIRGDAKIPCDLEIPTPEVGMRLDYQQVNVLYAPSPCDFRPLFYVESLAKCQSEAAWYYDDVADPLTVKLCPSSCDLVRRPGSSLKFSIGCDSVPAPPR